jgi:hypothetical protein
MMADDTNTGTDQAFDTNSWQPDAQHHRLAGAMNRATR